MGSGRKTAQAPGGRAKERSWSLIQAIPEQHEPPARQQIRQQGGELTVGRQGDGSLPGVVERSVRKLAAQQGLKRRALIQATEPDEDRQRLARVAQPFLGQIKRQPPERGGLAATWRCQQEQILVATQPLA